MSVRYLTAIIAIAWMALVHDVHATSQTLPFVDHFAYSDGSLFSVTSAVWDAGGGASAEFIVSANAAVISPTGVAVSSGKGVLWSPSGTAGRNFCSSFPPPPYSLRRIPTLWRLLLRFPT